MAAWVELLAEHGLPPTYMYLLKDAADKIREPDWFAWGSREVNLVAATLHGVAREEHINQLVRAIWLRIARAEDENSWEGVALCPNGKVWHCALAHPLEDGPEADPNGDARRQVRLQQEGATPVGAQKPERHRASSPRPSSAWESGGCWWRRRRAAVQRRARELGVRGQSVGLPLAAGRHQRHVSKPVMEKWSNRSQRFSKSVVEKWLQTQSGVSKRCFLRCGRGV